MQLWSSWWLTIVTGYLPCVRKTSRVIFFCVPADTYDQSGLQEVQLEDGSTAYIQHTVHMPQSNTILAIQADGTIADLQADATALNPETISVLEQYATKVSFRDYSLRNLFSNLWVLVRETCVEVLWTLSWLTGGEYRKPIRLLQQSGSR